MEENKEIIDKKNAIQQKINIEQQNNANINNTISFMSNQYQDRYNNYDTVTEKRKEYYKPFSLYQINNLEYLAQKIDKANLYYRYVEVLDIDDAYAFERQKNNDLASTLDIRFMLQNHYNHINARLMAAILDYYECELEYWKSFLKQIEIENIKEFE